MQYGVTSIRFFVGLSLGALLFSQGGAEESPVLGGTQPAGAISYVDEIHPLLAKHCYSCHAGGIGKGEFRMDTREDFLKGGESGPAVVEGNSAGSRLMSLVSGADPDLVMPPKGEKLTPEEVAKLAAWIDQGLAWEEVMAATDYKVPVALMKAVPPLDIKVRNPLDRWMAAYWKDKGITPGEPLGEARFMRRVYLDAKGLLPSREELEAFLADGSADKREKLIDTVLGDNLAYAEHWMTFWNDHLRNDFEGTGYIDGGRKPITDWLFHALYENMPFNEFAEELIAPRIGSRGFIDGIVWRGVVPAAQRVPLQAAINVSQVFMGVNLKCASCHDSFVDSWKLNDAYGFANCFSEEPLNVVRCEIDSGKAAEYQFLLKELGAVDASAKLEDRQKQVAALTISEENGYFSRTIVNRLWARLMGYGFVMPLDTMDKSKPWHPEMLDWLARDLITHDYDLKRTIKLIMTSKAYQLPGVAREEQDHSEYMFKGPEIKRMNAEQFYDALSQLTGVWRNNAKYNLPGEPLPAEENGPREWPVRAWRAPADALMRSLGRPNREQVMTRRESLTTTLQALEMSNGATLADFLHRGAEKLASSPGAVPDKLIENLFLVGLGRDAGTQEAEIAQLLVGDTLTAEGIEDLLWTVAMLPEFQLIY